MALALALLLPSPSRVLFDDMKPCCALSALWAQLQCFSRSYFPSPFAYTPCTVRLHCTAAYDLDQPNVAPSGTTVYNAKVGAGAAASPPVSLVLLQTFHFTARSL